MKEDLFKDLNQKSLLSIKVCGKVGKTQKKSEKGTEE
jgi:hypothetical protein